MAIATKTAKTKAPVAALKPVPTRLTMTLRELEVEGRGKSWRHCWIFAQFAADSGDAEMAKVMDCFRKLKRSEQQMVTPEYVCDLAGVEPNDFAAEVFREYLSYSGDAGNLIAAAGHPKVVKAAVKFAQTEGGDRDRKMLLDHAGFLPQKQSGGIHVNASATADNQSATIIQAPELPSMENDTMRYTRFLKQQASPVIDAQAEAPAGVPALTSGEER